MTFSRLDYKTTEKLGRANLDNEHDNVDENDNEDNNVDDNENDNAHHHDHDFIDKVKRSKTLDPKVKRKRFESVSSI